MRWKGYDDSMGGETLEWRNEPSEMSPWAFYSINAAYDLAGRRIPLTYPNGRHVTNVYNGAGRLTAVKLADFNGTAVNYPYASAIAYAPTGALTSMTYGNGLVNTIDYNNRLQPVNFKTVGNGQTLIQKTYGWYLSGANNPGNVWSITDVLNSSRNQSFGYDALNRLSVGSQADGAFNQTYSYDAFGNMEQAGSPITTSGFSINTSNQMVGGNIAYDAAGNMTKTNTGQILAYDAENQITSVNSGDVANYTYGPAGERIRKDLPGSAFTEYTYFGGEVITEKDQAGNRTDYIYADGAMVAREGPEGRRFLHSNNINSARMETDGGGNVVWQGTFSPFGQEVNAQSTTNHYKFTGKERDAESGNDYFGARYYASSMGRFMSPDPTFQSALSADPQTWNRYSYALNSPLTITDPNGELWEKNVNGGWDWGTWCPIGATCVAQIAQQEGNNVVTYGPSSANDKQSFAANKQGYVNVSDIAATDGAYFELKSGAHSYASSQTAVDLYNGAFDYHLANPNDSKLFVTDIGKSDGSNLSPHKTHNLGRSIDFRYMDSAGKSIGSDRKLAAIWYADDSRMETMVNIFKENGFNQNYSDDDRVYGTSWASGHDTHIHFGKTSHLGQCEIGPCK